MALVRTRELWTFNRLWRGLANLAVGVTVGLAMVLAMALVGLGRPAPATATTEMPYGRGLLWQVDGAGPAPSYVFGTMHSADEEVTDLAPPVADALADARSLSIEVVMTPQAQASLALSMTLSDGRTLEDVVGPDLFDRAVAAGQPYGFGERELRLFKPWAIMTLFSLPPSEVERQAAGAKALDNRLQEAADQRGLPVYGLEQIEEQIALFNDMAEADQIAMLDATIAQSDQVEATFEKMRQAYLAQDTAGIFEFMQAQQTGFDPDLVETFTASLLDARNERMVERMAPRLAEGGAFVAVGALHLPGENGVLKRLEDQGYQVTRLY
jgi:uncharacterized protein YbaP (TraB family)